MKLPCLTAVLLAVSAAESAPGQTASDSSRRPIDSFFSLGSPGEDRARLAQLVGGASTNGWLLRTPSAVSPTFDSSGAGTLRLPGCNLRWSTVPSWLGLTWNSQIPVATNSGGVWSGRGVTVFGGAGVRGMCGRLRLQVYPEFWYAANQYFAAVSANQPGRSNFANPFHAGPGWSADIPVRWGTEPLLVFQPGQSSVEVSVGPAVFGLGSESQWWGPAIRNALVMSNNAAGIPAGYVRTAQPVDVYVGRLEARWITGFLTESPFFSTQAPGTRSIAGIVATLTPAFDSNLTVGATRVVYAGIGGLRVLPLRVLDPFTMWGPDADVRRRPPGGVAADQLSSLFARWVFPRSGAEVYGEWARVLLPTGLRSLLTAPQFTQGFTVGLQWTGADLEHPDGWRVQAEATNLEQTYLARNTLPNSFYTSPTVPQGYTQRGRSIGAMIGPGSSSLYLAIDRQFGGHTLGLTLGRVRWDNDAYYLAPTGVGVWAHDVSLTAGFRASRRDRYAETVVELDAEQRMNFLFQSATSGYTEDRTFDVHNVSLRISVRPGRR